jgi:hypothetical protein
MMTTVSINDRKEQTLLSTGLARMTDERLPCDLPPREQRE